MLSCSEMCVCDLAQTLDMTQSAISHQLRLLKQMKLVVNRREGKTVFYSLADSHIKTIMNQGMGRVLVSPTVVGKKTDALTGVRDNLVTHG